jgi:hypothetical protein
LLIAPPSPRADSRFSASGNHRFASAGHDEFPGAKKEILGPDQTWKGGTVALLRAISPCICSELDHKYGRLTSRYEQGILGSMLPNRIQADRGNNHTQAHKILTTLWHEMATSLGI